MLEWLNIPQGKWNIWLLDDYNMWYDNLSVFFSLSQNLSANICLNKLLIITVNTKNYLKELSWTPILNILCFKKGQREDTMSDTRCSLDLWHKIAGRLDDFNISSNIFFLDAVILLPCVLSGGLQLLAIQPPRTWYMWQQFSVFMHVCSNKCECSGWGDGWVEIHSQNEVFLFGILCKACPKATVLSVLRKKKKSPLQYVKEIHEVY